MVYYKKFLICVRATYPELEFRKMVVHNIGHSTVRKTVREIFNNKNLGKSGQPDHFYL